MQKAKTYKFSFLLNIIDKSTISKCIYNTRCINYMRCEFTNYWGVE